MSDQFPANFNQEVLEADIARLTAEVTHRREMPENTATEGKELLRQSIQSMAPVAAPIASAGGATIIEEPVPNYAMDALPETKLQIEQLLELAFQEGIEKANDTAVKASPFVLDAFHDALTGKLYPEFQKRGILE